MKPEKLILKGLYSYKNETVIDFSTLCRADLFGIFGNVGSGKSAILEAITYVLYGKIERLSTRVYYNMMNLMSDRMYIDFTFSHAGERYRFTFDIRRNKKIFEKIETPERGGYIEKDEEWIPLFDKDYTVSAEGIIGLSYDNFRRTVIVPQGKFQEFLHLEKGKRTEMLMELFQLDRFDLYSKAADLAGVNARLVSVAEGELSGLDYARKEGLSSARKELSSLDEEMVQIGSEVKKSDGIVAGLEELQKLSRDYFEIKAGLEDKLASSEDIEKRKKNLTRFELCRDLFRLDLSSLETRNIEYAKVERSLGEIVSALDAEEKSFRGAELEFSRIEVENSRLEEYRTRAEWYSLLIQLKTEEENAAVLQAAQKKEQVQLAELLEKNSEYAGELGQSRAELAGLDTGPLTADLMRRLSASFAALEENNNSIRFEQDRLKAVQVASGEVSGRASALPGLSELIERGRLHALPESLSKADEAVLEIENWIIQVEKELGKRVFAAGVAAEVLKIAGSLEEGKACPVCGAIEHPSPAAPTADCDDDLRGEEDELERVKKLLSSLKQGVSALRNEESALEGRRKSTEERIAGLQDDLDKLTERFPSDLFSPDNPEAFKAAWVEYVKTDEKRQHLQQMISALTKETENCDIIRREKEARINELNISMAAAGAGISGKQDRIDGKFLEANRSFDSSRLAGELKTLENDMGRIVSEYERLDLLRKKTGLIYEKRLTEHSLIETRLSELSGQKKEAFEALERKIEESEFSSLDEVSTVLGLGIEPERERAEIEFFIRETDRLKSELSRLERLVGGRVYDERKHQKAVCENEELKQKMNYTAEASGRIRNVIADLEKRLIRKKELQEELRALRIRGENINTIRNLFKAKKFIDYVSTVYLRELCAAANDRFRKLTRESLRLELDEANNFIVRDYLNEGKIRSIKTLSGGQTFQAAFSLSLALADSIGKERSGFFFLDEGFGSLDRESLALVFESLKSLKREERTVGIISHVEELKQEIDTYITVRNETEEGSDITSSWNN
ncbi:MAG: SMC family ATPase [Spirochaetales bacterium]|nr:SMC family ATPase [Spirochaetales bacterium]